MSTPQRPDPQPPPDRQPPQPPDKGRGTTRRAPSSRPGAGGVAVPGIWSPAYRLLTTGLVLTIASFAFEAMAVATALPVTLRDLGGLELYGWAFSAMQLATLLGTVLGGLLSDRRGLVRPFLVGVGLFVGGLVAAGLAQSMAMVVAGRAVQGLGAGMVASAAYVAVGRGYPAATKAPMLAALSSAWVVPGLVGPLVAGGIADHISWRLVFLGLVPLLPVATVLALPALRRLDRRGGLDAGARTARDDAASALRAVGLTVGTGLLLAGLGNAGTPRLGGPLTVAGVALVAVTLPRLLPAGTLRARRGLPAAIATGGLLWFGYFGAEAFLPLSLVTVHGLSVTMAGLVLGGAAFTWASGSWLQARLSAAGRRGTLIVAGTAIVSVAVAGAAAATFAAVPPLVVAAAWAVGGLGMGLGVSTVSLVVLEAAEPGREGGAASALQLSRTLGAGVGTGAGGALVGLTSTAGWSPATGIRLVDGLALAVVALAVLTGSRTPRSRPARGADAGTGGRQAA
jgi:MFS family permease